MRSRAENEAYDDSDQKSGDRDVFNERPTREEQSTHVQPVEKARASATVATIHTTKGDIVSPATLKSECAPDDGGLSSFSRMSLPRLSRISSRTSRMVIITA